MIVRTTLLLVTLAAVAAAAGCASAPERPYGAVLPMAGGGFKSSVKSSDASSGLKTFTRDAEITCAKGPAPSPLPWVAKPLPAKYAVVSQTVVDKNGKDVKSSDNKMLDAGIAVGLKHLGLEPKDAVEITTIFRCD